MNHWFFLKTGYNFWVVHRMTVPFLKIPFHFDWGENWEIFIRSHKWTMKVVLFNASEINTCYYALGYWTRYGKGEGSESESKGTFLIAQNDQTISTEISKSLMHFFINCPIQEFSKILFYLFDLCVLMDFCWSVISTSALTGNAPNICNAVLFFVCHFFVLYFFRSLLFKVFFSPDHRKMHIYQNDWFLLLFRWV